MDSPITPHPTLKELIPHPPLSQDLIHLPGKTRKEGVSSINLNKG